MILERFSILPLAALAALALACGSPSTNTPDSGGGPSDSGSEDAGFDAGEPDAGLEITATNYCLEIAKRRCDYWIRCASEATTQIRFNSLVEEGQRELCIRRETASAECQSVAHAWTAGRVAVDGDALLACYDTRYPSDSCSRYASDYVPLCMNNPWITGLVANGGKCNRDDECSQGFCSATADSCGMCTAYLAQNAACTRNIECNPAVGYCRNVPQSNPPRRECAPYVALGSGCFSNDFVCGPGNICGGAGGQGNPTTCRVAKQLNEPCGSGAYECLRRAGQPPELICSAPSGTSGTCIRAETETGQPCQVSEPLARGAAAKGPACPVTDWCSNASTCEPRLAKGSQCIGSTQCAQGLRCYGSVCSEWSGLGEPCDPSSTQINDCAMLLECPAGECVPEVALLGEDCSLTTPCAEGFCASDGKCTTFSAAGATCTANSECQSGACDAGSCDHTCWD